MMRGIGTVMSVYASRGRRGGKSFGVRLGRRRRVEMEWFFVLCTVTFLSFLLASVFFHHVHAYDFFYEVTIFTTSFTMTTYVGF